MTLAFVVLLLVLRAMPEESNEKHPVVVGAALVERFESCVDCIACRVSSQKQVDVVSGSPQEIANGPGVGFGKLKRRFPQALFD